MHGIWWVSGQALSPFLVACTPRAGRIPQLRKPYVTQPLATQARVQALHIQFKRPGSHFVWFTEGPLRHQPTFGHYDQIFKTIFSVFGRKTHLIKPN